MAIGYTGSDGNIQEFQYTPVDPQEDMMRQAFERSQAAFNPPPPQPQGPTPYWENPATYYPRQQQIDPIEQAKAATAAAYKYIAFRGYQQDLKEGKSAADAFAKWGPMLVQDVSLAPTIKALQPTPTPTWMPADPTTGRPGTWINGKVTVPSAQGNETVIPPTGQNPGYIRDAKGGIHFFPTEKAPILSPADEAALKQATHNQSQARSILASDTSDDAKRAEARQQGLMAAQEINRITKKYGMPTSPYNPFTQVETPVKATVANQLFKSDNPTKPNEIIRLTRDGRKAVFDSETKQFLRYANE